MSQAPAAPPRRHPSGRKEPAGSTGGSGGGGGGGFLTNALLLVDLVGLLYVCRGRLMGALREYFPSEGGASTRSKSGGGGGYGKVNCKSTSDDDANSIASNSCGLSAGEEELNDPIAEEWAARLKAQREGKAYQPAGGGAHAGAMVCAGAWPVAAAPGPVPSTAARRAAAAARSPPAAGRRRRGGG